MTRVRDRLATVSRSQGVRKIGANFGWLLGERGVSLLLSLTVGVWVARYLGPELFGTLSYALAFVGLFGTFTYLGISGMVVRDLVEQPEQKDEILGTVFVLKLAGALLAIVLIALLTWHRVEGRDDRLFIAILSGGMVLESIAIIAFWYQSRVESRYTVRASLASSVISAGLKCALILLSAPLIAFVAATVFQQALNTALLFLIYRVQGESVRQWRFSLVRARSLLSRSWPLLLSSVGSIIYLRVDQIMLQHFMGSREVGIYAVAARLSEVWYFIPTALAGSLFPKIIQYKSLSVRDYEARMQRVYRIAVLASLGIAIPVTAAAVPVISLLYGAEYRGAAPVLMIHIWTCPAIFMGAILSKWLISEDLQMFSLTRHGFGALANVALNFVLIPRYGAVGAAVATLVSYTVAAYLCCFSDRRTFATGVMMTRALVLPFRGVLSAPASHSGGVRVAADLGAQELG